MYVKAVLQYYSRTRTCFAVHDWTSSHLVLDERVIFVLDLSKTQNGVPGPPATSPTDIAAVDCPAPHPTDNGSLLHVTRQKGARQNVPIVYTVLLVLQYS